MAQVDCQQCVTCLHYFEISLVLGFWDIVYLTWELAFRLDSEILIWFFKLYLHYVFCVNLMSKCVILLGSVSFNFRVSNKQLFINQGRRSNILKLLMQEWLIARNSTTIFNIYNVKNMIKQISNIWSKN